MVKRSMSATACIIAAAVMASQATVAFGIPPTVAFAVSDTDGDGRGDVIAPGWGASIGGSERRAVMEFRNTPPQHTVLESRVSITVVPASEIAMPRALEFATYVGDGVASVGDFHIEPLSSVVIEPGPFGGDFEIDLTDAFRAAAAAGTGVVGVRMRATGDGSAAAEIVDAWAFIDPPPCPTGCPMDYDQSGGIDGDDLFAFLADWLAGSDCTDADRSGGVDGDDWTYFFHIWQNGSC